MTQRNSAQLANSEVAWRGARKSRTLAQRRADFEAQLRAALTAQMALTDLSEVSARLHALHERYEAQHGRLTQQDLARGLKVAYRTLQSWVNGEVETDRANYDKLARFYARKLGDKTITVNWVLFGQQEPPPPLPPAEGSDSAFDHLEARLSRVEEAIEGQLRLLLAMAQRLGVVGADPVGAEAVRAVGEIHRWLDLVESEREEGSAGAQS